MNNNLVELIQVHLNKYPKMTCQDVYKLIFQNEFAGGHMIVSPEKAFNYLEKEVATIKRKDFELYESIGNDISRLNLNSLYEPLFLKTLNQMFVITANNRKGSMKSFEKKLKNITDAIRNGHINLSMTDWETLLDVMKDKAYPQVHHSDSYRKNYEPAYRVVDDSFINYFSLFQKIDELMLQKKRVLVAIDGNCGSGKSSLGKVLHQMYESNLLHMDDFYLPQERKTDKRLSQPGGNVDYERFKSQVLNLLPRSESLVYQPFDCKSQSLKDAEVIDLKPLVIVEGSYSMHPDLLDDYDLKVFLKTSKSVQEERILKRNGPQVFKRFVDLWIPLENKYFEYYKLNQQADLIFDTSNFSYRISTE